MAFATQFNWILLLLALAMPLVLYVAKPSSTEFADVEEASVFIDTVD